MNYHLTILTLLVRVGLLRLKLTSFMLIDSWRKMGLNESYSIVRSQILLMDPLPTVNKAYALLLQEERQRSVHQVPPPNIEQSAMAASHSSQSSKRGQKPFYHCDYCGMDGHSESRCYRKKKGIPPKIKHFFPKHKD